MKRTVSKLGLILVASLLVTGCLFGEKTLKDSWTNYENEKLGIELSYPKTYTLEEKENGIAIYHFKEQPVPYFTITIYEKPIKEVVAQIKEKVVENDTDNYTVTTFSKELQKDIDTNYIEENDKTYAYSCFAGLYEDICETIEFTN